jgi:predicted O-methyltransferase YrrM
LTEEINQQYPKEFNQILEQTNLCGFSMSSDVLTCSLLRTLASSKPSSNFLELGTGTGLSTSWILDGMDEKSHLISIDNEKKFLDIAKMNLGHNQRLNLVHMDAGKWIENNKDKKFDLIFADTWHGKYLLLDEVLSMLKKGGLYILDDMLAQTNWPEGHAEKVENLIKVLEKRDDLLLTKQVWATGIILAVKK